MKPTLQKNYPALRKQRGHLWVLHWPVRMRKGNGSLPNACNLCSQRLSGCSQQYRTTQMCHCKTTMKHQATPSRRAQKRKSKTDEKPSSAKLPCTKPQNLHPRPLQWLSVRASPEVSNSVLWAGSKQWHLFQSLFPLFLFFSCVYQFMTKVSPSVLLPIGIKDSSSIKYQPRKKLKAYITLICFFKIKSHSA